MIHEIKKSNQDIILHHLRKRTSRYCWGHSRCQIMLKMYSCAYHVSYGYWIYTFKIKFRFGNSALSLSLKVV